MAEQRQSRKRRIPKLSAQPEPGLGRYYASYRDPAGKPRRKRFSKDRTESELAYHRWVVENYDQAAVIIAPDEAEFNKMIESATAQRKEAKP